VRDFVRVLEQLAWWTAQWAVLFALWLLLVGNTDHGEALVGAGAAIAGTVAMHVVERQHLAKFLARPDWLLQIWRLPKYVLTGTWEILSVLTAQLVRRRPAPSLMRTAPYEVCEEDDASATERALAVAYTTMTPNFIVLGIDQARHRMVFHQLKQSEVPTMARRLGAGR